MFETHGEWWDILCNINTGKVILSPSQQNFDKYSLYDNEFLSKVNAGIASHYGEESIRLLFQVWKKQFVSSSFSISGCETELHTTYCGHGI